MNSSKSISKINSNNNSVSKVNLINSKINIYGEGNKGKVINNKELSLILKDKKIRKIQLISLDDKYELSSNKELNDFFDLIYSKNDFVIKLFKDNVKLNFKNECKGLKNIYNIFKDSYKKYSTLYFLKFKNFKFIGFKIICENTELYAIINSMCTMNMYKFKFTRYDIFNKFIENTLSSLVKLQEHKYAHTDLKPDNIIYCSNDDRFKIIDWEMSKILSLSINIFSKYYANKIFNSPLAFVINGKSVTESIKSFENYNIEKKQKWFQSDQFQVIFKMYKKELYDLKDKYVIRNVIFEKYKYHLDLFAIATVYYSLMYSNNLDITDNYIELFTKMISLNGFLNVKNAYNYFNSNFIK